jgi:serine/threonine-protein kinase ULK/ATG1
MSKIKNEVQKFLLENEIKVLKKLNHPNVLNLKEIYETVNNTYLITDFCNNGDLAKILFKKGKLSEK